MINFRAINTEDIKNLENGNNIYSTIINSYNLSKDQEIRRNVYRYYDLCIKGKRKYALDTITGHVSGSRIRAKISSWVSVTPDFEMAAGEYSVPQSGKYNYYKERKPIVLLDIPDEKILSGEKEILKLRSRDDIDDFAIDLRSHNLSNLFNYQAAFAEKYNMDMPGYNVVEEIKRLALDKRPRVSTFSNFATVAQEIVVFSQIKREYIKAVMSPELVDILYACNVNIEEYYEFITKNYIDLNTKLKALNNEYLGKNLIEILVKKYNCIEGTNIEEKYQRLKEIKTRILSSIVKSINEKHNTNFRVSRLLDDKIIVKCYENLGDLSSASKNDLILIEKDNKLYEHNFDEGGFYNEETGELITTKEILEKMKKRARVKMIK